MSFVKTWCALLFLFCLSSSEILFAASDYVLDSENSSLYFVSTKNTHNIENHFFTDLSGSISDNGEAELIINLGSIETGIELRNQRVRDNLFEVDAFSQATVSLPVSLDDLAAQTVGSSTTQNILASLNLHGVTAVVNTEVTVIKISNTKIMVKNASPIIIAAEDYNLTSGIETLRTLAGLVVIGYTVPVNFTLFFNAQQ